MRILDKYIIREMMGIFIFGIFAFSSVFIGSSTLFRIAQYVSTYGASVQSIIKLFIYSLPSIIVLTFPMSILLAALLAFGRLSGSSEITSMKSGGISFYRIAAPVIIVSLFISVFAIAFNEIVVPKANEGYANTLRYEIQGNTAPKSQEHIILKDFKDGQLSRLTYAREYNAETNRLHGVSVQEFENEAVVRMENAETAEWTNKEWVMHNGSVIAVDTDGNVKHTMKFEKQILPIPQDPKKLVQEQKKPDQMTMRELRDQIKVFKAQHVKTSELESELYQRITIPFASFVFVLIGVPLGLQPNRRSSSVGFGLSIIVIFVYYVIMTISATLGKGGSIPPLFAAWLPDIVGTAVGVYLMNKAGK